MTNKNCRSCNRECRVGGATDIMHGLEFGDCPVGLEGHAQSREARHIVGEVSQLNQYDPGGERSGSLDA